MFLDVLRRRNPALIEHSIALHQAGSIPANSYVIDLDAVTANASSIRAEADRLGLTVFAMTKQMGRNASFCEAVKAGGIDKAVAVDMECARACHRAGLGIGHIGHLVQIARAETAAAASFDPDFWTVFNLEKAQEAAKASKARGRNQPLLARIQTSGDRFYRGHEGGFEASDVVEVARQLDALEGGRFAGITTFPALLFDPETRRVKTTPNVGTLERAATALRKAGHQQIEINAPGTTSTVMLEALAKAGATQVEPGHGLTGMTPLHAVEDLPERPAVVYLSEVSHLYHDQAYCIAGGLYIDPIFPDYDVKAVVAGQPTSDASTLRSVEIPAPAAIDYYGMIQLKGAAKPAIGDSVVFGFRPQIFVTRAYSVGVSGLSRGKPKVERIDDAFGRTADWPV
jgi:predicted amino acid racemase